MDPVDAREELDRLQQELSARHSTRAFAQFAISLAFALILAGAAAKLFWDSARFPWAGILVAAFSLGLAAWSVGQYRRGKALLQSEVQRFERMQALRRALRLDDPAALLPES